MCDKTVTEILEAGVDAVSDLFEDIKEQMCDEFCRWPHELSQRELDAVCEECPLERL